MSILRKKGMTSIRLLFALAIGKLWVGLTGLTLNGSYATSSRRTPDALNVGRPFPQSVISVTLLLSEPVEGERGLQFPFRTPTPLGTRSARNSLNQVTFCITGRAQWHQSAARDTECPSLLAEHFTGRSSHTEVTLTWGTQRNTW